ncbi:hypothetical protein KL949_004260 [Ogataea haglerorum]|nr:hypothetical protein KL950_000792 [Ogataea haglerorum]KAG7714576.1 hypothetical protein KL913_004346 [Ogataea haglerorum]KAG7715346.1 hypothetical protein KL949_004260 [Ogataea haglerorum]KAG7755167.1 hypothetical protein KL947_004355 [Ogataea haglerorum]
MQYSPANITVDSDEVTDAWKVCVMNGVYFGGNEYSGSLGVRVSSVFVILFVSTCFTMFPLVARRIKSLRIPELAYLLARHFGSGVILATAYVHLMDPAYEEIGPSSCVGMSGHWADYSWPPALMLISVATIFTLDVYSEVYVEQKYGPMRRVSVVDVIAGDRGDDDLEQELTRQRSVSKDDFTVSDESMVEVSFRTQIAAFLILEFGVVFHSVMIGLNLGACGYNDFRVLQEELAVAAVPVVRPHDPDLCGHRHRRAYHIQPELVCREHRAGRPELYFGWHSDVHGAGGTDSPGLSFRSRTAKDAGQSNSALGVLVQRGRNHGAAGKVGVARSRV